MSSRQYGHLGARPKENSNNNNHHQVLNIVEPLTDNNNKTNLKWNSDWNSTLAAQDETRHSSSTRILAASAAAAADAGHHSRERIPSAAAAITPPLTRFVDQGGGATVRGHRPRHQETTVAPSTAAEVIWTRRWESQQQQQRHQFLGDQWPAHFNSASNQSTLRVPPPYHYKDFEKKNKGYSSEACSDTSSGGGSWFHRLFRRRHHHVVMTPAPSPTSVESSPMAIRRNNNNNRIRRPADSSVSSSLSNLNHNNQSFESDSLSAASSFIAIFPSVQKKSSFFRRNKSTPTRDKENILEEGETIRAMRTNWEQQMMMRASSTFSDASTNSGRNRTRKKRPAPPPPSSLIRPPSTHVPGKRRAPSPPSEGATAVSADVLPVVEEVNKWTNDLSSNLDQGTLVKHVHEQPKSPSTLTSSTSSSNKGVLKLEDGLLRPVNPADETVVHQPVSPMSTMSNTSGLGTLEPPSGGTIPVKPWYKRQHVNHNQPTGNKSKWKDSALLSPTSPPASKNHRRFLFPADAVPPISNMSPPGSPDSGKSIPITDKRRSLLVNISQLDREAAEIIRMEKQKEWMRRRMDDERFYQQHQHEQPKEEEVIEVEENPTANNKNIRQVIDMFNALGDHGNKAEVVSEGDPPVPTDLSTAQSNNNPTVDIKETEQHQAAVPDAATPISSSNNSSITRLRVNNETVLDGGAKPKRPLGGAAAMINGHLPLDHPPVSADASPDDGSDDREDQGWTCSVCTLINAEARLWCEACTALRPRNSNNPVKPIMFGTRVVTSSKSNSSAIKWETEIKKYFNTTNNADKKKTSSAASNSSSGSGSSKNPKNTSDVEPKMQQQPGNNNNNNVVVVDPVSADSLRKARLAYFSSTSDSDVNNRPKTLAIDDDSRREPENDVHPPNLNCSRSQLERYMKQKELEDKANDTTKKGVILGQPQTNGIAGAADKEPSVEDTNKMVASLLRRLEESIASGQFDQAAVIAKELAAIKRSNTAKEEEKVITQPSVGGIVSVKELGSAPAPPPIIQPVPAPRIISLPSSSSSQTSPSPTAIPQPTKRVSHHQSVQIDSKQNTTTKNKEIPEDRAKPSPSNGTKVKVDSEQNITNKIKESTEDRAKPSPSNGTKVKVDSEQDITNKIKESSEDRAKPSPSNGTKVKVDSEQQTTISYPKKKASQKEAIKVALTNGHKEAEPLTDWCSSVEVVIEDRSAVISRLLLADVRPDTQLRELKERVGKERGILPELQRWIVGRELAVQEEKTLKEYGVLTNGSSVSNAALYLYVIDPEKVKKKEKEAVNKEIVKDKPTEEVKAKENGVTHHNHRYFNAEEDRYSTCEDDSELSDAEAAKNKNKNPVIPPPVLPNSNGLNHQAEGIESKGAEGGGVQQSIAELDIASDVVPNAEEADCPVCLTAVPAASGAVLRDCLHTFCKDCLAHVIEFSDEAAVGCPFRNETYACPSTLQEREIRALVSVEVYEKHLARSVRLAEKGMSNTFHCQTADCAGWAVVEDNLNIFRCPVCRKTNCLTCQAIHEGMNCKEYQDGVQQNAETDEDAKRTHEMIQALVESGEALSCPHCQVILMKRWGCDWVRCSVCRTEICWVTKQPRWGPKGKGDTSAGCQCGLNGVKCHPKCNYCH